MTFVVLNKDGSLHGAFSAIPENYVGTTEFDIGQVKNEEPFDARFNYTIVDGVAIRGDLKPVDTEDALRIQQEVAANKYKRDRAAAYPSFADQFDLLYHGGYDAWKAAIDAVKTQFPKP